MKTNTKIVVKKVREHILSFFDDKETLKNQIKALNYVKDPIMHCIEGGSFLCYYSDIEEFLNSLGINPENKEYSNEKIWNLYKMLLKREIINLLKVS